MVYIHLSIYKYHPPTPILTHIEPYINQPTLINPTIIVRPLGIFITLEGHLYNIYDHELHHDPHITFSILYFAKPLDGCVLEIIDAQPSPIPKYIL